MELDELKKTWEAVEDHCPTIMKSEYDDVSFDRQSDVKAKLLRRMIFAASCTLFGLVSMATSRLWAPIKLQLPLLLTICAILFAGFLAEVYVARSISKINLLKDTPAKVLKTVIRIKKFYRKMELWFSVLILATLGWMTLSPSFIDTDRWWIVWIMVAIAFSLEYVWFRKTMRHLNELSDFENN